MKLNNQEGNDSKILGSLDDTYLPSLSNILGLPVDPSMSLQIEKCTEEQQEKADEYNSRANISNTILFSHRNSSNSKNDSFKKKPNESVGKYK